MLWLPGWGSGTLLVLLGRKAVCSCADSAGSAHRSFCLFPPLPLEHRSPFSPPRSSGTVTGLMSRWVAGPLYEKTILSFLPQIASRGNLFLQLSRSRGRREGRSKTPETMAAKVTVALDIQRKLPADPREPPGWEMLAQEEKSLFQHASPGLCSLGV